MRSGFLSLGLLSALLMASSCSQNHKSVKADGAIRNSFAIVNPQDAAATAALGLNDKKLISIRKDALDKEFLLQASMMRQVPMPTANGLKSRVVAFKRSGESLFLMEATQGHVITKDLPSQLILARLPIVSETNDALVLDFSQGMASTFVSGDWYGSDDGATYIKTYKTVDVKTSFIDEATFSGNALSIRQIAQVVGTQLDTVEVKYYLEPYAPSADFVKTPGQGLDVFGFFQVAPLYQSDKGNGVLDTYASKWNDSKPIVYAVSANTPKEYVQAVTDGILYWNRAMPKANLQVVMAPAGVSAPNYDYNVVQWVPWDTAGYAYADAQMDPRTGEIRHAQVFMTSTFAVSGASRAKSLLKTYPTKARVLETAFSMAGMVQKPLCNFEAQENFFAAMENLLEVNAPDQEYLRISQDYIREVVAHEVGHTLGLRHNFAGSLSATYTLDQRAGLVADYVSQAKLPIDLQPSSSVMEYQTYEEAAFTGHIMQKTTRILDYDKKVIDALYRGTTFAPEDVPLFCSDSHTDHLDCQTFDLGKNPLEGIAFNIAAQEKALTLNLFNTIVRAKRAGMEPSLVASTWANRLLGDRLELLMLTHAETPLIQVRRKYTNPDDYGLEKMHAEEKDLLLKALVAQGGWNKLMKAPGEKELQNVALDVRKMMRDSKDVLFSLEEQQKTETLLNDFAVRLNKTIIEGQWTALSDPEAMVANDFTAGLMAWIDSQAQEILLTRDGNAVVAAKKFNADGSVVNLSLPKFKADAETRLLVAGTLNALPVVESWKVDALKENLRDALVDLMDTYLPEANKMKYKELDAAGQEWRATEQSLIQTLSR